MTTVSTQRAPGLITRPAPTAPFVGRPPRTTTTSTAPPPRFTTTTTTSTTTAPAPRLVVEKPVSDDYLREQARKKQQPVLRGITTQADLETAPPLTTAQEALIKRVYYDQKLLVGRDGLWHYMAGKYKNAPSQKQVGRIHTKTTTTCIAAFVAAHRPLLTSLLKLDAARALPSDRCEELARLLARLYTHLATLAGAGKHAGYIIADYLVLQQEGVLSPKTKAALLHGLYALLDVCSTHEAAMLHVSLDEAGAALFKQLRDERKRSQLYAGAS